MNLRRFILLLAIIVVAVAGWVGLTWKNTVVEPDMTYAEFHAAAVADLDVVYDDLIVFDVPEAALFQAIRENAAGYLPLMRQLMTDVSVSHTVKLGAAAAMMDLPPRALAGFVSHLIELADQDYGMMRIIFAVVDNSYRGSSFGDNSLIARGALMDASGDPVVREVLRKLWDHPNLPANERAPGTPLAALFGTP